MNEKWWKLIVTKKGTEEEVVIDNIDFSPIPFRVDEGEKLFYVYFLNGVEHKVTDFEIAELVLMNVCNDPNCKDPDCQAWQKENKEKQHTPVEIPCAAKCLKFKDK